MHHFFCSQTVVDDSVEPPRTGYMHFVTDNEAKARSEAALVTEAGPRYFLAFDERGALVESTGGTPVGVIESATRKLAQRLKLEEQAAAHAG